MKKPLLEYATRPATVDDSPALARIQVDSYRTAYAGILPQAYLDQFTYDEQEQDWRDLISGNMADLLMVVDRPDGRIAGYALGRPHESDLPDYDSELIALHIRQSEQGQGAGRVLAAAMAGQLKDRGCQSMMLWVLAENEAARAFYQRLGGRLLNASQSTSTGAVEVAYGWPVIGQLVNLSV